MKTPNLASRWMPCVLLGATLAASVRAQSTYTELISPDNRPNARFGRGCGGLPDLNRDGVGEFYVLEANRIFVYDGSSLNLLYPIAPALCSFGFAAARSAGDLNGDGVPELMINLECAGDQFGQVMFADGRIGTNLFTLSSPNPVSQGFFGMTLRLLPDMNGNGSVDWLVHQPESSSSIGRAYLIDSSTRDVIRTIENSSAGFSFHMQTVEVISDVDADGKPELLIADFNSGRAVVRSLQTGDVLYELHKPEPGGALGNELESIGDITGDGIGDIAVGNPFQEDAGVVYLFSGNDGQWLRTLRPPNPVAAGRFGRRIESVPDLNADGVPDLLIQQPVIGVTHLYSGATSTLLRTIVYPGPIGPLFQIGAVGQTTPPGLRAYLFGLASGGPSSEGRAYYMPFTPVQPTRLRAVGKTISGVRLQVSGEPGLQLEMQATSDFTSWVAITNVLTKTEATEVEDSSASQQQRFYRTVQRK